MKKKKKQENEKPKNIHYPQSIKDNNAASVMRLLNLSISSKHMLSVLLIFVLAIALYTNTLKNGFAFDDEYTIVNNIMIKDLGNLPKLFNKDYFTLSGEMSYRPLVTFS